MKSESGKVKVQDGRGSGKQDQLLRSGTSVGAHFREAQRAKSNPDFISKIEGGTQELEETMYWLELLEEAGLCTQDKLESLKEEADELMAILSLLSEKPKQMQSDSSFSAVIIVLCFSFRFPISAFTLEILQRLHLTPIAKNQQPKARLSSPKR